MKIKCTSPNERFGASGGVVSADKEQLTSSNVTKQFFLEVFEKYGKEKIYAFALYSDESAMTVCPSINTLKFLDKQDKDDYLYYKYEPMEWNSEIEETDELFDEISTFCSEAIFFMSENEDNHDKEFAKFQNQLYETCIEVLEKLKSENFFKQIVGEDIFLLFSVSDYEFSKKDLKKMAARLNDNEYRNEYFDYLKTW